MKKLNRREFLELSIGAAAGSLLAACAPKATEAPAEKPTEKPTEKPAEEAVEKPAEPEQVTISIMWRTSPYENKMLEGVIAAWHEKQSAIAVESIIVPWDEFEPKLMALYAAGDAPDIIGMGGTNPYVERGLRGMVLALDPYLDADTEFLEDLFPGEVEMYTIGGKVIALPNNITYPGVFYNKTHFDEAGVEYPPIDWKDPGWTWADMVETAKALTLDKDGDGKIDQFGLDPGHASPWYYTRLWGQDLVSEEDYASGLLRGWQLDDPAVYDACVTGLQARADAVYVDQVTPTPATMTAISEMGSPLKTGAVAMVFTGSWAVNPPLPEEFEIAGAVNPKGFENGTRVNMCFFNPHQICSQTEHSDAAWEFLKFETSDLDAIAIRAKEDTHFVTVKSGVGIWMDQWAKYMANPREDLEKLIIGAIEDAKSSCPCHILAGWSSIRDIFNAELDPVWLGEETAKEAVDRMRPLIDEGIKQYLEESGLG